MFYYLNLKWCELQERPIFSLSQSSEVTGKLLNVSYTCFLSCKTRSLSSRTLWAPLHALLMLPEWIDQFVTRQSRNQGQEPITHGVSLSQPPHPGRLTFPSVYLKPSFIRSDGGGRVWCWHALSVSRKTSQTRGEGPRSGPVVVTCAPP